jgi:hypothetical protein
MQWNVVIAGVEQKAHYLVMDLPHSDDCFAGLRASGLDRVWQRGGRPARTQL